MPPKQLYNLDTKFWIFKSNYATIDTIDKYNRGEYTKINMNPTYSDTEKKYKRKICAYIYKQNSTYSFIHLFI